MPQLKPGDPFPAMRVSTVDGRNLTLPADLEGEYAVVLFYRAHW